MQSGTSAGTYDQLVVTQPARGFILYEWFRVREGDLHELHQASHFIYLIMQDRSFFAAHQRLCVSLTSVWFELLFMMVSLSKPLPLCYGVQWFEELTSITHMGNCIASFVTKNQLRLINMWLSMDFLDMYESARQSALLLVRGLVEKKYLSQAQQFFSQWSDYAPKLAKHMPTTMAHIGITLARTKNNECLIILKNNLSHFFDFQSIAQESLSEIRRHPSPDETLLANVIHAFIDNIFHNNSIKISDRIQFFTATFGMFSIQRHTQVFTSLIDRYIRAVILHPEHRLFQPLTYVVMFFS